MAICAFDISDKVLYNDIEKYILHLLLSPLIKKAGLYVFIIGGYKLLLIAITVFSFFL